MLRAVGNPVAVNPDPPLAEIAREEGWQTLRFERLGRRLVAVAITLLATVAGFGASRSPPAAAFRRHGGCAPARVPGRMEAATARKIRVVVAKPGLDGHDRGAKIIARALRDAGMEVIYTGLHQTPEQIAETVIQEDADAVGLSILSGAHMTLVPKWSSCCRSRGRRRARHVGGTIPADDVPELKKLGVAEVFTPGAGTDEIVEFIRSGRPPASAEDWRDLKHQ